MIKAASQNINTVGYWEKVYREEQASSRQRVDDVRWKALLRWVEVRRGEMQRPMALLDVGCGLGDVALKIKDSGYTDRIVYSGVDISPGAIASCKERLKTDRFRFYTGSAQALPMADETSDITWCGETLEHLNHPDAGMCELIRVTNEGGFIVISTPYRRRNTSPEHVWEFTPADVCKWGAMAGELVYLDCLLLESWLTMFAVFRRALSTVPS
jgi:ubiquinone/menaquinone biosynthesis C-methylase UbiE